MNDHKEFREAAEIEANTPITVGSKTIQRLRNFTNILEAIAEIQSLESELTTARERIKQLERCAVVGGDGEPIGVGDMVAAVGWVKPPEEHQRKVVKTKSDTTGKWIDVGFGWHEADRFFIVSPAVPETLSRKETKQ